MYPPSPVPFPACSEPVVLPLEEMTLEDMRKLYPNLDEVRLQQVHENHTQTVRSYKRQQAMAVYAEKVMKYGRVYDLLMAKGMLSSVQREDIRHALDICEWVQDEVQKRIGPPPRLDETSENRNLDPIMGPPLNVVPLRRT